MDTRGCGLTAGHEPPTPGSRGPSAGAGIRCRGWSSEAVWTRRCGVWSVQLHLPPTPLLWAPWSCCWPDGAQGAPRQDAMLGLPAPRGQRPPPSVRAGGAQVSTGLDHRAGQGARSQAVLAPDISVSVSSLSPGSLTSPGPPHLPTRMLNSAETQTLAGPTSRERDVAG